MANGCYDIAKAGWLYRQSSVLHRWKKNWFVLDRNGDLRYFETPDNPRAEERIVVRAVVMEILTGHDCRKSDYPEAVSHSREYFLELRMRDRESMLLFAESADDMRAWQIAMEEARTLAGPAVQPGMTSTTIIAPPGYVHYGSPYIGSGYGGHVISHGSVIQPPATQVIYSQDGSTTYVGAPPSQQIVYVDDGPYRYRRYHRGGIYPVPLFFW
uniref:PH domain-containing protein n=1 Tax=Arion vulgaris TaxID=1028688 RepID=A0A0B6XYK6_9EUPU